MKYITQISDKLFDTHVTRSPLLCFLLPFSQVLLIRQLALPRHHSKGRVEEKEHSGVLLSFEDGGLVVLFSWLCLFNDV